jgi:hypothetical protein
MRSCGNHAEHLGSDCWGFLILRATEGATDAAHRGLDAFSIGRSVEPSQLVGVADRCDAPGLGIVTAEIRGLRQGACTLPKSSELI